MRHAHYARRWCAAIAAIALCLAASGCSAIHLGSRPINREAGVISPGKRSDYRDGRYAAVTDTTDTHGFGQQLILTVRDGIITRAIFAERRPDGAAKAESALPWLKNKTIQSTAALRQQLIRDLIAHQDPQVDTVTGATETSGTFRRLARAALRKSADADTSPAVVSPARTYTATLSSPNAAGITCELRIRYRHGRITRLHFRERMDGESRRFSKAQTKQLDGWMQSAKAGNTLSPVSDSAADRSLLADYNAALAAIRRQRQNFKP